MEFIGDYVAEFKRGKDKKPRKKRMTAINAVGYGALAGVGVDTARRIGAVSSLSKQQKNRFVKTGKMPTAKGVERILKRNNLIGQGSNVRSLKAYGVGAAAGLGAYGAYKLGKRIRDRRKGK